MGSQTALQAWQTALFAQIDAAAVSLTPEEVEALFVSVEKRAERRRVECVTGLTPSDA